MLIAHRGWSKRFPENSIPAFAAAFAAGADEIELDARVSADGTPVICHDATLDRVSTLHGRCDSATTSELRSATMRMPDGSLIEGMGFATLAETLDLFGKRIVLNLHVKDAVDAEVVLPALANAGAALDEDLCYVAGDAGVLDIAKRTCPHLSRCLVSTPEDDLSYLLRTAESYQCSRIQFFVGNFSAEHVRATQAQRMMANFYFVDDPSELDDVRRTGLDAVLTNDIGLLKANRAIR